MSDEPTTPLSPADIRLVRNAAPGPEKRRLIAGDLSGWEFRDPGLEGLQALSKRTQELTDLINRVQRDRPPIRLVMAPDAGPHGVKVLAMFDTPVPLEVVHRVTLSPGKLTLQWRDAQGPTYSTSEFSLGDAP